MKNQMLLTGFLLIFSIPLFAQTVGTIGGTPGRRTITVKDSYGQSYPVVVLKDEKMWLGENLNIPTKYSFCYNNNKNNCNDAGRLYTWNDAKQACPLLLGLGWRLPSVNDYKDMIERYGGLYSNSNNSNSAYISLRAAPFNAALGGQGTVRWGGAHDFKRYSQDGNYWTSSRSYGLREYVPGSLGGYTTPVKDYYYIKLNKYYGRVSLEESVSSSNLFSVRCIKD